MKIAEALSEYINKNLSYPKDLAQPCKDYEILIITHPLDLSKDEQKSKTSVLIWETTVKAFIRRRDG